MTRQEIYDRVASHLLSQMEVSRRPGGFCLYRGPRNLKCAIGALIPDELYDTSFDDTGGGLSAHALPDRVLESIFGRGYNEDECRFLDILQAVHDSFEPGIWNTTISL